MASGATTADWPARRSFEVRPGRRTDANSFLVLWREVVNERRYIRTESANHSVRYYRRRFFKKTWHPDQAGLVAVQVGTGRVIGHLSVSREEGPVTRHVASLGMVVASDWRRRGVGTALLQEAIRWGREMGVEKLALSVYPDNHAARALYRKLGFVEEGCLTGHSKKSIGYRDEIVMGLWLVPRPPSGEREPL